MSRMDRFKHNNVNDHNESGLNTTIKVSAGQIG